MVKRRYLRGLILWLTLIAPAGAAAPPTAVVLGTLPQPAWNQLSTQQKSILAPLAKDWEKMENVRRKKWLGIADRYPSMKADEQFRMQERMREWARFTPEQRAKIRDSYKDFKQLPAEQKTAVKQKWEAYSSLPAAEKQRLREGGKSTQLLTPSAPLHLPIEDKGNEPTSDSLGTSPQPSLAEPPKQ